MGSMIAGIFVVEKIHAMIALDVRLGCNYLRFGGNFIEQNTSRVLTKQMRNICS